jgi:hypothetical protein
MRALLYTFIILGFIHQIKAQYYIRTKQNIGLHSMYNFRSQATQQVLTSPTPFLQLGLCRQFGKYAIPEMGITLTAPHHG